MRPLHLYSAWPVVMGVEVPVRECLPVSVEAGSSGHAWPAGALRFPRATGIHATRSALCGLVAVLVLISAGFVPRSAARAAMQAAVLQIRVLAGDGAVHPVGSRSKAPIVVEITDETGRPVEGAVVSFRLPAEGPGGVFANELQTDLMVTGPDGRATLSGLRLNQTPGPFQIRVTAGRGPLRAGTVIAQYNSDGTAESPPQAASAAPTGAPPAERHSEWKPDSKTAAPEAPTSQAVTKNKSGWSSTRKANVPGSKKKWFWVSLLAAGAAGGLAVGLSGGGETSTSVSPPYVPPTVPLEISKPSITIGKP